MVVIAQLVARRFHNPKVANSILTDRMTLNARRLILRLCISYRDHDFAFLPNTSRSVVVERLLFPPAARKTRAHFPAAEYSPLQAIGPPRLSAAFSRAAGPNYFSASQHHAGVSSRGNGATAARLTPGHKVGTRESTNDTHHAHTHTHTHAHAHAHAHARTHTHTHTHTQTHRHTHFLLPALRTCVGSTPIQPVRGYAGGRSAGSVRRACAGATATNGRAVAGRATTGLHPSWAARSRHPVEVAAAMTASKARGLQWAS